MKKEKEAYDFEFGNVIFGGDGTWTAEGKDFITCQKLPLWMHCQQDSSPGQQIRSGLFASKEEAFAFFNDVVDTYIIINIV